MRRSGGLSSVPPPSAPRGGGRPAAPRRRSPAARWRRAAWCVLFVELLRGKIALCPLGASEEERAKKLFYEEFTGTLSCLGGLRQYLNRLRVSADGVDIDACVPFRCKRATKLWEWLDVKAILERMKHRELRGGAAHAGELQSAFTWLCEDYEAASGMITKAHLQDAVDTFEVSFAGERWRNLPQNIDSRSFMKFFSQQRSVCFTTSPGATPSLSPAASPRTHVSTTPVGSPARSPRVGGAARTGGRGDSDINRSSSISEFGDEADIELHCFGDPSLRHARAVRASDAAKHYFLATLGSLRTNRSGLTAPRARWRALSHAVRTRNIPRSLTLPVTLPPAVAPKARKGPHRRPSELLQSLEDLMSRSPSRAGSRRTSHSPSPSTVPTPDDAVLFPPAPVPPPRQSSSSPSPRAPPAVARARRRSRDAVAMPSTTTATTASDVGGAAAVVSRSESIMASSRRSSLHRGASVGRVELVRVASSGSAIAAAAAPAAARPAPPKGPSPPWCPPAGGRRCLRPAARKPAATPVPHVAAVNLSPVRGVHAIALHHLNTKSKVTPPSAVVDAQERLYPFADFTVPSPPRRADRAADSTAVASVGRPCRPAHHNHAPHRRIVSPELPEGSFPLAP